MVGTGPRGLLSQPAARGADFLVPIGVVGQADDHPALQKLQIFQYLLAPRESGGMADALDLGSFPAPSLMS